MKARTGVLGLVAALACVATVAATAFAAPVRLEGQGNIAPATGKVVLIKNVTTTPAIVQATAQSVATGRIGPVVSLGKVLADRTTSALTQASGGTLAWKSTCGSYDDVLKPLDKKKRVGAWCWDGTDETSLTWMPQGITSTAESSSNGMSAGERAVAVTWYRRTTTNPASQGIRVSLFPTPAAGRNVHYNHVALVTPSVDANGYLTFSDVKIHAGGAAWYGPYLFVPDTNWGVRVFDVRTIHQVAMGTRTGEAYPGAVPTAIDARYAMLQVASYRVPSRGCTAAAALPPCFSSLSIDRSTSPARLVASENLTTAEYDKYRRGTSVVAWSLGPDWLPVPDAQPATGTGVTATSAEVMLNFTHDVQGAIVSERTREIYSSASTYDNGWLYYEKDGDGRPPRKTSEWPASAESITNWYGTGRIWSLTERTRGRVVFDVYACELRGGSSTCR